MVVTLPIPTADVMNGVGELEMMALEGPSAWAVDVFEVPKPELTLLPTPTHA